MESLPYDIKKVLNCKDILDIKADITFSHTAILTGECVYVHDSKTLDFSLKYEISRSGSSLDKFGRNHWIQWINRKKISFGTKTGYIIFAEILYESGRPGIKQFEFNINSVITSTFSCGDYLCVINHLNNITIIDESVIIRSVQLQNIVGIITNSTFHEPNSLICCCNGQNYNIHFDIRKTYNDFKMKKLGGGSALFSFYIAEFRFHCVVYLDGSISMVNCFGDVVVHVDGKELGVHNEVLYCGCMKSSVVLIFKSGDIVIKNLKTSCIHRTNIGELKLCNCIAINTSDSLLFNSGNEVFSINFAQVSSNEFFYTNSRVISLPKNETVLDISESSRHNQLYPIHEVYKIDKSFFVYNENCYSIFYNGGLSGISKLRINSVSVYKNCFVVGHCMDDELNYAILFISSENENRGLIHLPHICKEFHFINDSIVVTCNIKYSIISLGVNEEGFFYQTEIKTENLDRMYYSHQLKKAVCDINNCLYFHFFNNALVKNGDYQPFDQKVMDVTYFEKLHLLIAHKNSEVEYYYDSEKYVIPGSIFSFNGTDGYYIPYDVKFGKIEVRKKNIIAHLLSKMCDNSPTFLQFVHLRKQFNTFHTSLVLGYNSSFSNNNQKSYLSRVCKLDPSDKIHFLVESLNELNEKQLNIILSEPEICKVFLSLPYDVKTVYLNILNNDIVMYLCNNNLIKGDDDFHEFVLDCFHNRRIVMGVKVAVSCSISLLNLVDEFGYFSGSNYNELYDIIQNEFVHWGSFAEACILGSTLIIKKYYVFALALYMCVDKRKISSILSFDPALKKYVK